MHYQAPVIDNRGPTDQSCHVPALYGIKAMRENNMYVGTRKNQLIVVPLGLDDKIIWPAGTKLLQAEESPSGHMILVTSYWEHWKGKEQHKAKLRRALEAPKAAKL